MGAFINFSSELSREQGHWVSLLVT